jgi:hypothetical protein
MTAHTLTSWLAVLCLVGCAASPRNGDPRGTLHAYAAALRAGDAETAYGLLSEQARKRMPYEAFARTLAEKPDELLPLADALSRPAEQVEVVATVTADNGDSLQLVLEDGEWKADMPAIHLYSQATPLSTLGAFVRAFEAKRYDVLLAFAPNGHKEGLTQQMLRTAWEGDQQKEMVQLVAALKVSLPTARVEMLGDDRATVAYGAAGTVQLLLEDGLWKIEEF